jgi:hypothetical protein
VVETAVSGMCLQSRPLLSGSGRLGCSGLPWRGSSSSLCVARVAVPAGALMTFGCQHCKYVVPRRGQTRLLPSVGPRTPKLYSAYHAGGDINRANPGGPCDIALLPMRWSPRFSSLTCRCGEPIEEEEEDQADTSS